MSVSFVRYPHLNNGSTEPPVVVHNPRNFSVWNGYQSTRECTDPCHAKAYFFHRSSNISNLHRISYGEAILENEEKPGENVTNKCLSTKAYGNSNYPCSCKDCCSVNPKLLQDEEESEKHDEVCSNAPSERKKSLDFSRVERFQALCKGSPEDETTPMHNPPGKPNNTRYSKAFFNKMAHPGQPVPLSLQGSEICLAFLESPHGTPGGSVWISSRFSNVRWHTQWLRLQRAWSHTVRHE